MGQNDEVAHRKAADEFNLCMSDSHPHHSDDQSWIEKSRGREAHWREREKLIVMQKMVISTN